MKVDWIGASGRTYVDTPELLNTVEADDLLQELVPVLLAARRLGEPEGPSVLKLVLDVEVGRVVEDTDDVERAGRAIGGGIFLVVTLGRDGDGVERDGLGGLGGDVGHVCGWMRCVVCGIRVLQVYEMCHRQARVAII